MSSNIEKAKKKLAEEVYKKLDELYDLDHTDEIQEIDTVIEVIESASKRNKIAKDVLFDEYLKPYIEKKKMLQRAMETKKAKEMAYWHVIDSLPHKYKRNT